MLFNQKNMGNFTRRGIFCFKSLATRAESDATSNSTLGVVKRGFRGVTRRIDKKKTAEAFPGPPAVMIRVKDQGIKSQRRHMLHMPFGWHLKRCMTRCTSHHTVSSKDFKILVE